MASITFQNYFRMYKKLAGMTGTADTEAYEFQDIYGLETVVVPTHRKMIRQDAQDKVFRTTEEKYQAIGRRLGFGGGYYDRYLTNYHGKTIALALPTQLADADEWVSEAHDQPVDQVLTLAER